MRKEKENKIQQDCVIWFNNTYCLKFHDPRFVIMSVPNEGENAYEIKRKVDRGMLKGASDLIVITNKEVIFFEVKTPTGVQSDNQKDFEDRVNKLGHKYFMFRSLKEFQDIVKQEIDGKY